MLTRKVSRSNSKEVLKINLPEELKWNFGDVISFELTDDDNVVVLRRLNSGVKYTENS